MDPCSNVLHAYWGFAASAGAALAVHGLAFLAAIRRGNATRPAMRACLISAWALVMIAYAGTIPCTPQDLKFVLALCLSSFAVTCISLAVYPFPLLKLLLKPLEFLCRRALLSAEEDEELVQLSGIPVDLAFSLALSSVPTLFFLALLCPLKLP